MNKKLLQSSFLCALGTVAYIAILGGVMSRAEHAFDGQNEFFIAVTMLTLFVVSAAVTGSLVVGKPVMMYIDGAKKEAIKQLAMTIAWLAGFVLVCFLALIVMK